MSELALCESCEGPLYEAPRSGCGGKQDHQPIRNPGLPTQFAAVKEEWFPIVIKVYSSDDDELLWEICAEEPGALYVPGRSFFRKPVEVEIITNAGISMKTGKFGYEPKETSEEEDS